MPKKFLESEFGTKTTFKTTMMQSTSFERSLSYVSVWSLKSKAVVWLLTGFMLGQSTLISYHTEANGYIFFAAGVSLLFHFLQRLMFVSFLLRVYLFGPKNIWTWTHSNPFLLSKSASIRQFSRNSNFDRSQFCSPLRYDE